MADDVSAIVKLKSEMPPNTVVNGMADLAAELSAHPGRRRLVIAIVDVCETRTKHETDDETGERIDTVTPILRVRAIEQATPDDQEAARLLLARAREGRQARERNAALALFNRDA